MLHITQGPAGGGRVHSRPRLLFLGRRKPGGPQAPSTLSLGGIVPVHEKYLYTVQVCWSDDFDGLYTVSLTAEALADQDTRLIEVRTIRGLHPPAVLDLALQPALDEMFNRIDRQLPLPF